MYERSNINKWVEVSRIQTAMVTSLALWVGYISVQQISLQSFTVLGLIGVLVHVWGFMLNEVNDKEYDERYSHTGHPLSSEELNIRHANIVAWVSGIVAVMFSMIVFDSRLGMGLLLLSFIAGTLYNTYSKRHWWSNIYLSVWVLLLTFAGAAFAGSFSMYTWVIGVALSIQIFVQVIEGDLKDILGPEHTMAERFGVQCDGTVMTYPSVFRKSIIVLKLVELSLLGFIVHQNITTSSLMDIFVLGVFALFASIFIATTTLYLISRLDRDKIKKRSSIHELASIIVFGITSYWLDNSASVLIALAPVVWYLLINKIVYEDATNPDI